MRITWSRRVQDRCCIQTVSRCVPIYIIDKSLQIATFLSGWKRQCLRLFVFAAEQMHRGDGARRLNEAFSAPIRNAPVVRHPVACSIRGKIRYVAEDPTAIVHRQHYLSRVLKMRRIACKGVPAARGINPFKLQARDPGERVNCVYADIGYGASVLALFKIPRWA